MILKLLAISTKTKTCMKTNDLGYLRIKRIVSDFRECRYYLNRKYTEEGYYTLRVQDKDERLFDIPKIFIKISELDSIS